MHFTEDTVARLRERIVPGARVERRFWSDDQTPHGYHGFYAAKTVDFDDEGRVTITYDYYTEGGTRKTGELYYGPQDLVALAEPDDDPHHDNRLYLAGGGYMQARPGRNLQAWDVYGPDATPLAQDVRTAVARALLGGLAPKMIWVNHGDGNYTAKGNTREWRVQRGGSNPAFTAHMPLTRAWLYTLSSRHLGTEETWETVREGLETPQEAQQAVPESEAA